MNLLSAVIITWNEEENIGRCLDSLKQVAEEIIVLDSFSTDKTVAIARQKGAVVIQSSFSGYIEQKNKALQLTRYNYVLSLDADEALSPQLIESVLEAKKDFKYIAYNMNRYNHYCGRFIKYGLWYPDQKVRLFNKKLAHWSGMNPHDKIYLSYNLPVGFLKGDLLHYSFNNVREHKDRNERMSSIAAQSIFDKGQKKHWSKIFLSPAWSFFNGFILRLGFLDGYYGFIVAKETARLSFLKYQKLKALQKLHNSMILHNYKTVE
jgi:glycosyltransferase involved in cell wall biosynthesis